VAEFRIARIGAGPAGYFAAQALQSAEIDGSDVLQGPRFVEVLRECLAKRSES